MILGAGGHAKVVLDAIHLSGARPRPGARAIDVVGLLDSDPALRGSRLMGIPVIGGDEMLPDLLRAGVRHAFVAVGAVGDNSRRQSLAERLWALGFHLLTVVHPGAWVSPHADLGEGTCVLAGAIINAGARVGRNAIVNTGAVVEHDCRVADHAHIAPGARLAAGVEVGAAAHVGLGACVLQGRRVGAAAVVGAGAVVTRDVPAGATAVGVPARWDDSASVRGEP